MKKIGLIIILTLFKIGFSQAQINNFKGIEEAVNHHVGILKNNLKHINDLRIYVGIELVDSNLT